MYAQGIERFDPQPAAGDEVDVYDSRGNFLGRGLFSPHSAIVVRLFDRRRDAHLDEALLQSRIRSALARRRAFDLPNATTNAYRLLHAEGDQLPGLIVDIYADTAVLQLGTVGMAQRRDLIVAALRAELPLKAVLDRSSPSVAKRERFQSQPGLIWSEAGLDGLNFRENGLTFQLPLAVGQKTGFYLDQRTLRARVEQLARDRRVLDCYCFVGAAALFAARGGAKSVTAVDSSAVALEAGKNAAAINGLHVDFQKSDALTWLEQQKGADFNLVLCDPPKLAPSRGSLDKAMKIMRRLVSAACRATAPEGLLIVSSCSSALGMDSLCRAVALGARDAERGALVLERIFQGPDHPVPAAFPEGLYLSSVLVQVTSL